MLIEKIVMGIFFGIVLLAVVGGFVLYILSGFKMPRGGFHQW